MFPPSPIILFERRVTLHGFHSSHAMTSAPSFFSSPSTYFSISRAIFPPSPSSYVECAPCSNLTLKPFLRPPLDDASTQFSLWIPKVTISSTPSALRSAARSGLDSKTSSTDCHVSDGNGACKVAYHQLFCRNTLPFPGIEHQLPRLSVPYQLSFSFRKLFMLHEN